MTNKNIFDSDLFTEERFPIVGMPEDENRILILDENVVYDLISEVKEYNYLDNCILRSVITSPEKNSFRGVVVDIIYDGHSSRDQYDIWINHDGSFSVKLILEDPHWEMY